LGGGWLKPANDPQLRCAQRIAIRCLHEKSATDALQLSAAGNCRRLTEWQLQKPQIGFACKNFQCTRREVRGDDDFSKLLSDIVGGRLIKWHIESENAAKC